MNIKERYELIDGFFNKGWACNLDEVYNAVIGTIKELEESNDKKQNRITELEEINKQHQEINGKLRDELENSCWDEASVRADVLLEQQDYEERCQKAIEYINHAQNYGTMAQVMPHLKPYVNGDDLLNILQDKEEV